MSEENTDRKQPHRWQAGQSGNPAGKPKGARHKALLALDAIGAEGAEDVMRSVVKAAMSGDMRAAEILLRRLWPERKGQPVMIELPPVKTVEDIAGALGSVTNAVAAGEISPDEGQAIAGVLEVHRRAMETLELERRIAVLEESRK